MTSAPGVTSAMRARFESFGYLVLPGAMAAEIGRITEEFEATFADRRLVHDGSMRTSIVPFIDHRPRLRDLLDHPLVADLFSLLGPDWHYFGSDGNFYTGDTGWHCDGPHRLLRFVKVAFYLDPVEADSGALRVIPGSHRLHDSAGFAEEARRASSSQEAWGLAMPDVPCAVLAARPGDVVVFDHNIMHASFGGNERRRMFTLNAFRTDGSAEASAELRSTIEGHARFWMDSLFDESLVATAWPERRRRLEMVIRHQDRLPALAAQARSQMERPAWQTARSRVS